MARELSNYENDLFQQMRNTIEKHRARNRLRTNYVDTEHLIERLDFLLPDGQTVKQVPMEWPKRTIDVMGTRFLPEGFSSTRKSQLLKDLESLQDESFLELETVKAIKSSIQHGCGFVFTSAGDPDLGEPEVIVTARSAAHATAIQDPRTRRVLAALDVISDEHPNRKYSLRVPGAILEISQDDLGRWRVSAEQPSTRRVLCTPFFHDESTENPYGRSRITNTVMGITDKAVATLMRQEVSADWYSAPRIALLGASAEQMTGADGMPGWAKWIGAIWGLEDISYEDVPPGEMNEGHRRAEFHSLPQMTMQPFSDMYRLQASIFSGSTSIPLQYLGVVQDSNPTSAEAIRAQDYPLSLEARVRRPEYEIARRSLVADILSVAYQRDLERGEFKDLFQIMPRWADTDPVSITEQSQMVSAQVASGNLVAGGETALRLLPIDEEDARMALEENRRNSGLSTIAALINGPQTPPSPAVGNGTGAGSAALQNGAQTPQTPRQG